MPNKVTQADIFLFTDWYFQGAWAERHIGDIGVDRNAATPERAFNAATTARSRDGFPPTPPKDV